jgi:RNA polymerase sigma-70 factor (ECF subfamily)
MGGFRARPNLSKAFVHRRRLIRSRAVTTTTELAEVLVDAVDTGTGRPSTADDWVESFHRGDAATLVAIYEAHFKTVRAGVATVLRGADGETVTQDVFFRLVSKEGFRRAYRAGSFSSWLYAVARNQAIDYQRRRARETPSGLALETGASESKLDDELEARALVRKFCEEVLPPEWLAVFEARFLLQLDQREAARVARVPRTTLVYRELRIRALLRSFLLDSEGG